MFSWCILVHVWPDSTDGVLRQQTADLSGALHAMEDDKHQLDLKSVAKVISLIYFLSGLRSLKQGFY